MKLFLSILFLNASLYSAAQGIKEDLAKINQAYKERDNLYIDVLYKASEGSSIEIQKGTIFKKSNYLYNKIGEMETLIQDSLRITVDNSRKIIVLMPYKKDTEDVLIPGLGMDQALKKCTRITPFIKGETKGYELLMDDESFEKLLFTYLPENYMIRRLEFFYKNLAENGTEKKNVRMEMEYNYPKEDTYQYIAFTQFVKTIDGTYKLADSYKSYQLVDYTKLAVKKPNG